MALYRVLPCEQGVFHCNGRDHAPGDLLEIEPQVVATQAWGARVAMVEEPAAPAPEATTKAAAEFVGRNKQAGDTLAKG